MEVYKQITGSLKPTEDMKRRFGEVFTPISLINQIFDKLKTFNIFGNKNLKWFDPASGTGNFMVVLYYRLMTNLTCIEDETERKKHILENMLYASEITRNNVDHYTELFEGDKYKLNVYCGDTLKLDTKKEWGIDKFDVIIGNPPYNSGNTGTGNTIWQHFTKLCINDLLKKNGYLSFIHPPGWRKPTTKKGKYIGLYDSMVKDNQLLYLSIHGIKDGKKTFDCGTRYDWYILKKTPNFKHTEINDEEGICCKIDMTNLSWLPNSKIEIITNLLAINDKKCSVIYNRSNYGSDAKCTSRIETDEFKYKVIHTIPITGVRYLYSNTNTKGHFGVKKVIFGDSGFNDVIIDMNGEYGMSEHSIGIKVENMKEAIDVKNALMSDEFKATIKSCMWSTYRIDWRLFSYLKNDFWKQFETCNIIYDRSAYETRKKWISKIQTNEFKYPCIHSTPKTGTRYVYSKFDDKGHFGISKVIFGDSGINEPIIDMEGKYGMTHHAMGIEISSLEEGELLYKSLKSDKMKEFIRSCSYSTYGIDHNIFKGMKKHFWKEL